MDLHTYRWWHLGDSGNEEPNETLSPQEASHTERTVFMEAQAK